ncbi:unnamed protein product [Aphanomyces euteiches]|uniref:START domain-containing protein n=1 Tax=Aphanomyces euteiches TaxID=100861 RepID=A0A6G0WRI0_9STRA|nr:hypothetical protein Ae201684_012376 [Aphanomyces euteiches]KAH9090544.1 hypothetical protein Ae201684P_014342 [Aphanomyces euteiches]KAH9154650.1 hypothetical protein AeRB84_003285 [Aphanomyces euteiches]
MDISPPREKKKKKVSKKKQMQVLQQRIYNLENCLSNRKRYTTTLMPWEEVAKALKEDTLEQVRANRTLKREVEMQKELYAALTAWISRMTPSRKTPSVYEETWQHSHLLKGNDYSRRTAQNWIVQQSYHNTQRAMAHLPFPDSTETYIDVQMLMNEDGNAFQIHCFSQHVVSFTLEQVSSAFWVAENSFTEYRRSRALPTFEQLGSYSQGDLRYDCEDQPNTATQKMRNNCLHGRIRDEDRTTVVCRTIITDEAFPMLDSSVWTMDIKQWTVADRIGPHATRLRTFYTIDHPKTIKGTVPMEEIANLFGLPYDGQFLFKLSERMRISQTFQRELFHEHLEKVLDIMS